MGQETAEKQQPSALDFVAQFQLACNDYANQLGKKIPLVQGIGHVVAEYNKRVTVRKWRVDNNKKKIIINLLRCPPDVQKILAEHYDLHKHSVSGATGCSDVFFPTRHGVNCCLPFSLPASCILTTVPLKASYLSTKVFSQNFAPGELLSGVFKQWAGDVCFPPFHHGTPSYTHQKSSYMT